MRIVSLLPSATETLSRLSLGDQLVGVSADSDWPPETVSHVPVLNTIAFDSSAMSSAEIDAAASTGHTGASLYHVDPELLRDLHPDVILTQEICEVCSVSRRDVEMATRTLGYVPQVLSLNAVTLEDTFEDIQRIADVAHASSQGAALVQTLRARVEALRSRTATLPRPRVFCMEWLDPMYSAGHWVPEMVELAGGSDALGAHGGPSRTIAWAEVRDYAPEVIVMMPCSLPLQQVAAEFELLRRLPQWDSVPAVQSRQVYAGDTDLFSRSGPRLVDGVEILARLFHPEVFDAPLPGGMALKLSSDGQRLLPFA
jgi:iron complex transport system substrate-binding protein